ncbi:hypothetical protein M3Y99_00352900 [Aphelenchoides fujianensis]|nr:hypothetical protein M3Y99_00352900 [Aphelenchoides fujianensis]
METETDNPFRPQEQLYHEPNGSPIPQDLTPIKNGRHVTLESPVHTTAPDGVLHSGPTTTTFDASPKHTFLSQPQGNGAHDLPPPGNAELVHVDAKKKKCLCCSIS